MREFPSWLLPQVIYYIRDNILNGHTTWLPTIPQVYIRLMHCGKRSRCREPLSLRCQLFLLFFDELFKIRTLIIKSFTQATQYHNISEIMFINPECYWNRIKEIVGHQHVCSLDRGTNEYVSYSLHRIIWPMDKSMAHH